MTDNEIRQELGRLTNLEYQYRQIISEVGTSREQRTSFYLLLFRVSIQIETFSKALLRP